MKKCLLIFFLSLICCNFSHAAVLDSSKVGTEDIKFGEASPFDMTESISDVTSMVINAFLGLLATIFLVLMIKAGYDWMTAQGEEEKVRQAQHTIQRAIIGLLIVAMAYSITYFVMNVLPASGS